MKEKKEKKIGSGKRGLFESATLHSSQRDGKGKSGGERTSAVFIFIFILFYKYQKYIIFLI